MLNLAFLTMKTFIIAIFSSLLFMFSCQSLRETSKFEFRSAKYYTSLIPKEENRVYLSIAEDTIRIYPVVTIDDRDTVVRVPMDVLVPENRRLGERHFFNNPSFDIDLITNPLKYRFPTSNMPRQLTSNINGSVYFGYRNDFYTIRYMESPIGDVEMSVRHIGLGIGGFVGIGSEPINPWVTGNEVDLEYEGLIFTSGVAGIGGIENFTVGIALGFDYLLDSNSRHWIYQGKPWIGFLLGINLN
jgi:hypothetical protein